MRQRRVGDRAAILRQVAVAVPAVLLGSVLAASPAAAASPRVELRLLVVTDRSPEAEALRGVIADGGVPFDVLDLADPARPRLTTDALMVPDTVPHARYQGVVLPNEAPAGLDRGELAAIHAVERWFGLRQVDASVRPTAAVGLAEPDDTAGWSGAFDGRRAQLVDAARGDGFGDLRGDVPFGTDSYVEIAAPRPGFRPILTATSPTGRRGVLAGVHTVQGHEELVLTFAYDAASVQIAALGPALVEWVTRGVHLGLRRSYLAVHVDDVFLPNARWIVGAHCSVAPNCPAPPGVAPTIRMVPDDVGYAVAWQRQHGFRLDLAFNGAGSVAAAAGGSDPLTVALLAQKDAFGWISHTWSHRYLGCVRDDSVAPWRCATLPVLGWTRFVSAAEIDDEIRRNVEFALDRGLPVDRTELVTGEHSGLRGDPQMPDDNPSLAPALDSGGIATVATDASRERDQRTVGRAGTVPRWPIDLDFGTATVAETVDQYNWTHAPGGDGQCDRDATCLPPVDAANPQAGFANGIVPAEAAKVLDHVLGNDPRPHYVHQSQLTEARTIYPVLEQVLDGYRALFRPDRPLLTPTMTQSRATLARADAWARASQQATGTVRAWLSDGAVTVVADTPVDVPVTVPDSPRWRTFGERYGATRSAWLPVTGEQRIAAEVR